MLGSRWQYNIETRILHEEGQITVLMPDIHKEKFRKEADRWVNIVTARERYELREDNEGYLLTDHVEREIYCYGPDGRIRYQKDKNGNRIQYKYENKVLTKMLFTSGQELSFQYQNNKLACIQDKSGRKCCFTYHGELLENMTLSNQGKVSYQYTTEGYLTHITNENGKCYVVNQYDRKGRVTRQQTADGEEYIFMYNPAEKRNSVTRMSDNTTTTYFYNRKQLVERTVYDDGTETISHYDDNDMLTEVIDSGRVLAKYGYYDDLTRKSMLAGEDIYTEYAYDADKNLLSMQTTLGDEMLQQNHYTYDGNGNMLSKQTMSGLTTYCYDVMGMPLRV